MDIYETDRCPSLVDNPDVRATIGLYDMFGGKLYTLTHKLGEAKSLKHPNWKGEYFVKGTARRETPFTRSS